MRVELKDGGWAEVRSAPTNAQYVAIIEASERAASGRGSWIAWAQTVGQQLAEAGECRVDGKLVDLFDAWDEADVDDIDKVCTAAQESWREWQKQRRPKARKRPSSATTSAAERSG